MKNHAAQDLPARPNRASKPQAPADVARDSERSTLDPTSLLTSSDLRCRLLVENVVEYGIFMLDAVGRVASWNKGAERLMGYTESEILGQPYEIFFTPEDRQASLPSLLLTRAWEKSHFEEMGWRVRKDGTRFRVDVVVTALRDEAGRLVGYAKVTRDLTEHERLQQEKLEALQQADLMKDQFISILSHELRTPLNAILGFGSILDDEVAGPLNEQQHRYLRTLLASSESLLALVNDLLDMNRIQQGRFSLHLEAMSFPEVTMSAMSAMRPLAEARHHRLIDDVPPDLPVMRGDSQRIAQLLVNLVANAIKFTGEGGTIRVRACVQNGRLRGEVEDNGPGIAPENLPKLFKPFSQLDMSTTRQVGGTGLGLAICKSIVEAHGGTLGVESTPGEGSTFWFTLPVQGPR